MTYTLQDWEAEGKPMNEIICCDCLEGLKKIPDNSVDLVLTDPPYNIDFSKYNTLTGKNKRKFHYTEKLKWNNCDLKGISEILFKGFDRVLKETGSIIIFAPQEWAYYFYIPAIQNNLDFKCQIIWIKSNPIPQLRHKNYRSAHENIIWFTRYKEDKCPFTFNFINQKEMKNVFEFPILQGREREEHPTQKPLKLIRKLIQIHSNKNDLIFDPFLGSGTIAVACKQLGRKFIGFEINLEYCEIAKKRLAQEVLIGAEK